MRTFYPENHKIKEFIHKPTRPHDLQITKSCEITWKTKKDTTQLLKGLLLPNMTGKATVLCKYGSYQYIDYMFLSLVHHNSFILNMV